MNRDSIWPIWLLLGACMVLPAAAWIAHNWFGVSI